MTKLAVNGEGLTTSLRLVVSALSPTNASVAFVGCAACRLRPVTPPPICCDELERPIQICQVGVLLDSRIFHKRARCAVAPDMAADRTSMPIAIPGSGP